VHLHVCDGLLRGAVAAHAHGHCVQLRHLQRDGDAGQCSFGHETASRVPGGASTEPVTSLCGALLPCSCACVCLSVLFSVQSLTATGTATSTTSASSSDTATSTPSSTDTRVSI